MNRDDWAISAFTGFSHGVFHGFELSIPLFIPVWLGVFETSPAIVGFAVGAGYALVGILAPVTGVLADKHGSKRHVLLSVAGMGIAFAALSVVDSIGLIAAILLLWGMAASLYHPAGLSLISRTANRRGTVLAYHGAGGNLGMVVFPLLTVFSLAVFDWRMTAILLAVPSALCVGVGLLLSFADEPAATDAAPSKSVGETNPATNGSRGMSAISQFLTDSRRLFLGGFALVFALHIGYGMYYRGTFTFLPDVLAGMPLFEPISIGAQEIDASQFAYIGLLLVGVFGQYAGGVISDRTDPELSVAVTFLAIVLLSLLFIPASTMGLGPFVLVCVALGFAIYVVVPIGQVLVAEYVPEGDHGLSFGFVYLGLFGIGAVGTAMAGTVLEYANSSVLFVVLAGIAGGCAGLAGVLHRL